MNLENNRQFGQYRIVRLLGRGGMGEVYEVEHRVLCKRYALKLLPGDFASRTEAIRRFEREAAVMANLEHPHIVRVDEFGETEGRYWLRMELVKGIELPPPNADIPVRPADKHVQSPSDRCVTLGEYATQRGGRINQCLFSIILKQILEALAYAHGKGVVHRDLKPGNILLEHGTRGQLLVRVSDFGLARVIGEEFIRSQAQISVSRSIGDAKTLGGEKSISDQPTLREDEGTSTRALLGTWEYMSPEQRRGEEADARSDVYALGLMSYRLLTGQELGMEKPSEVLSELAPAWNGFIARALKQKSTERFGNGSEMHVGLATVTSAIAQAGEAKRPEESRKQQEAKRQAEEEQRRQKEAQVDQEKIAEQSRQAAKLAMAEAKRQEADQAMAQNPNRVSAWERIVTVFLVLVVIVLLGLAGWYYGLHQPAENRRKAELARVEAQARADSDAKEMARLEAEAKQHDQDKQLAAEKAITEAARQASYPRMGERWENTLGMKFVPVAGTEVLFCVWETRVRDYRTYANEKWRRGSWENPICEGRQVTPSEDCPVVCVSWDDAQAFCAWLTEKERSAGKLGPNQSYRLPADWEWSVAVGLNESRGGTPEAKHAKILDVNPWGTRWPPPRGAGNYASSLNVDNFELTSPVGSFEANRYGIYDLGGNVHEWCEDHYNGQSDRRVLRGASWRYYDLPRGLLSSYRLNLDADSSGDVAFGFRCVLEVGSAPR